MSFRTWDLESAKNFYGSFERWFHHRGYMLTIYGSVFTSTRPRDLDLLLIPWRPAMPPVVTFDEFCLLFRKTVVGTPYEGIMNSWSNQCVDEDGRVIDMQFRKTDMTMPTAAASSAPSASPRD